MKLTTPYAVLAGFDRLPASEVIPIEDAQVGILAARAGLTVSEAEGFRDTQLHQLASMLHGDAHSLHAPAPAEDRDSR